MNTETQTWGSRAHLISKLSGGLSLQRAFGKGIRCLVLLTVFQAALRQGRGERERAQNPESGQRQREGWQRGLQGAEEQDQPDGDVGGRQRRRAEQDAVRQHRHVPLVPLQGAQLLPHGPTGGCHDRLAGRAKISMSFQLFTQFFGACNSTA